MLQGLSAHRVEQEGKRHIRGRVPRQNSGQREVGSAATVASAMGKLRAGDDMLALLDAQASLKLRR
jgi:hypothetical protein